MSIETFRNNTQWYIKFFGKFLNYIFNGNIILKGISTIRPNSNVIDIGNMFPLVVKVCFPFIGKYHIQKTSTIILSFGLA